MILKTVLALGALTFLYLVFTVGKREKGLPPDTNETHASEVRLIASLPKSVLLLTGYGTRFREWSKTYGSIFSLKVGSATAIVLTSPELVRKLLDKKSNLYNHRPISHVGNGIIGGGDHVLLMQYGKQWQTCRKLIHQYFMEAMVMKTHIQLVNAEAVQMLRDFIVEPDGHMRHPKRFSNSIIMSLVYGTRTPTIETAHMKKLYSLMENWSKVMEPGNTPPVDVFPWLKWVPEQLLGMWRSRAQDVSNEMNKLYDEWHQYVIDRRQASGSRDCFVDRLLEQEEKIDLDRHALYFLCGTLMEGGSDTTSSIIIACIHAMTKWPAVLKKAQAQIDSAVGEDRSPVWEDYDSLPYIVACVKEAMRWRPVVPLAFPHSLAEDDMLDGMLLPKGSDIFINAFGMQHDEIRFPNPDEFDPDHYKGVTKLAPELAAGEAENRDHWGYGAGRRICPGIHLAERNLFLGIAKILWALDIQPGLDAAGNVIEPDVSNETGYSAGFLVCAEPYPARIAPRSEARKQTILREFGRAQVEVFSKYEMPKDQIV